MEHSEVVVDEYIAYLNSIGPDAADMEDEGGPVPWDYYNRYGEWMFEYQEEHFMSGLDYYTQTRFRIVQ